MTINGVKLDFDFTSPADMLRYRQAAEKLKERVKAVPDVPVPAGDDTDDLDFLDGYIEMLNQILRIYGDFIDDVYGDGVANQLLGDRPSMSTILSVREEIDAAIEQQGKELGKAMQKYAPNRATRRKRDK